MELEKSLKVDRRSGGTEQLVFPGFTDEQDDFSGPGQSQLFSGKSLDSERRRLERPNFLEQMLVSKLYVIELLF